MEEDRTHEAYSEVIKAFHLMWDAFPGFARLLNRKHMVLAVNPVAEANGFCADTLCAKVASPEIHKKCKMIATLKTGRAQTDRIYKDRLRGWQPVPGYPDVVVHFIIPIPTQEEP